jgi:hypothetical protein
MGPSDLETYRDEFPVLGKKAYLISASLGPVSNRGRRYLDEFVDAWATKGAPDPVWGEDVFPRMGQLKRTFGGMVGADPDELAGTGHDRSLNLDRERLADQVKYDADRVYSQEKRDQRECRARDPSGSRH